MAQGGSGGNTHGQPAHLEFAELDKHNWGGGVWYRSYGEDSKSWGSWVFTGGLLTDQTGAAAQGALHLMGRDGGNQLWR